MQSKQTPKITVVIRKRPLNKKELSRNETDIIKIENHESIVVSEYKQKVDLTKYIEQTTFNFDRAFGENSNNEQIYADCIRPLIDNAFEGAKISCFAYGQTGSGKTYTMKGEREKGVAGLYYLAAKEIFNYLEHPDFQHLNILVSFYEIYCGKLYDLLSDRKELKIREDKKANINIIGLEEKPIYSANEFLDIIEEGSALRITSQNATNADSSRSHAIMQMTLKDGKKVFTKVSFIDLAGNERGADHADQNKQTKIDGAEINKSLLALKECIRALDQNKGHTPFRGSKLTMVLKDSFVGFCKTVMIGNVSPNVSSSENTMNTLRYADRVKELKRAGEGNNLSKQEMLAKEMMLPRAANKNCIKVAISKDDDAEDIQLKLEAKRRSHNVGSEKMEVEQTSSSKEMPQTLDRRGSSSYKDVMSGKRTEANSYRIQQRKGAAYNSGKHESGPGKNNQNIPSGQYGSKKNIGDSQPPSANQGASNPLYQKNVKRFNIDQNNINSSNGQHPSSLQKKKPALHKMSTEALNRQHFDLSNNLHNGFVEFKDEHSRLVKEETIFIKEEMTKLTQLGDVDHFNEQSEEYLDLVENNIEQKIRIMNQLKDEVESLRRRKREVDDVSKLLGGKPSYQRQQFSSPMPMPSRQQGGLSSNAMELETPPLMGSIPAKQMNNGSNEAHQKYVYHSSNHQNLNRGSNNAPPSNMNSQGYQYSHSYGNGSSNNANLSSVPIRMPGQQHGQNLSFMPPHHQGNHSVPMNGHFSQNHHQLHHHQSPNHPFNDEQLLEDLPGDDNMQKLF